MGLLRRSFVLSCGIATSSLLLVHQARADSFTIVNGQTVNQTRTLDTTGDVGTVKQGGTINANAPNGDGINATANGVTVDNAGSVTGNGGASAGIRALDSSTVTNSGTASGGFYGIYTENGNAITNSGMASGGAFGIAASDGNTIANSSTSSGGINGIFASDGNTITNSGTASGDNAGIYSDNGNTITNSGTASGGSAGIDAGSGNTITNSGTASGGDVGIRAFDGNTITNSGTSSGGVFGIFASDGNTITNSGTASGDSIGIRAVGGNTITNSGTASGDSIGIRASDGNTITNSGAASGGDYGIFAFGGNTIANSGTASGGNVGINVTSGNTITNSGTIVGGNYAVWLAGPDNVVTLLHGSNIQGNLQLGDASNTLVIGRGLETALAFTGTPTIDTSGQPFVIADGTLYVVNATVFSVQDVMTNDLTRAVTGAVEGRLASARLTGGGMSMAMNGMTITPVADVAMAPDNGIWLSGLGSYRDQPRDGATDAFETALGGAVGGIDGMLADNTRAGLFAGVAFAGLDEDEYSQDLDSDNYFGGLYLGHEMGASFIDLSLTAGWSDFHSDRKIANNLVAGGIEHARADYGGFLISPSLRFGTDMAMGDGTFAPSIRLRYAGLFLDSYEESGSAANLTVDNRDINIFDIRGELAYRFAAMETSGGSLYQALRLGVDGTFSDADSVDAVLAGQALEFNVSNEDVARGFAGYDMVYAISGGASLNLNAEAGYDTSDAFTLEGRAGVAWVF